MNLALQQGLFHPLMSGNIDRGGFAELSVGPILNGQALQLDPDRLFRFPLESHVAGLTLSSPEKLSQMTAERFLVRLRNVVRQRVAKDMGLLGSQHPGQGRVRFQQSSALIESEASKGTGFVKVRIRPQGFPNLFELLAKRLVLDLVRGLAGPKLVQCVLPVVAHADPLSRRSR